MLDAYSASPNFLAIGHVTKDLHPDGTFSLGGTVTFAALAAYRLGLVPTIVTSADADLLSRLPSLLSPAIPVQAIPSAETSTFVNVYAQGFRTQYLRARASTIQPEHIPTTWRDLPVVLLGPLAQELTPEILSVFPRRPGRILAATPQGWLRRWDADGRVWPTPWRDAEQVLPLLDVLILSHDDLLPFANGSRTEADAILNAWSQRVPLLVATDGRHGATLYQQGVPTSFPAYPAHEVDPTGAGDVFAASFLAHLYQHGDSAQATNFANCAASFSVEQPGISGIPTPEQVAQRLRLLS
jgi:1D-myo-inositol 3-kinase